jgi:short-subunit dehydrogenase
MKNIVITGASRGIGLELTKKFSELNHQVLAISRNIELIKAISKNVTPLQMDLSKISEFEKVKQFLKSNWNQVDILINNAGKLINKPFKDTTYQDFIDVYNVNVFAVAEMIKVCFPKLKSGSHVVTISSMGGIQGSMKFPGLSAYSSSKGAVITLMELLAEEYKESNIAFNTLALGAVQTEMLAEAFPDYKAPISAKEMSEYIADFSLNGNKYFNGKIIQVSSTTP